MFKLLSKSHGEEEAFKMCRISLEPPKLTIRANTLKTTRQDLMKILTKEYGFDLEVCKYSPNGLRFKHHPKTSLFALPEYRRGHFEVQDEGSQLLAMRVDAHPKQTVLDYCGGAAGKTLAFAPFMLNTG
jgi:16S rRNA (cytosine967-C5)-methyltransferase